MAKRKASQLERRGKRPRREFRRGRGLRAPGIPGFLADINLKLPCSVFSCTQIDLEYTEPATPSLVTSVKGPAGQEITKAGLRGEILDAIFKPAGPGTESPEKRFPKTFLHDCPKGCTCPKASIVMGAAEDVTQEVEITVDRQTAGGTTKTYTVTVKIKAKRKTGTAKCT